MTVNCENCQSLARNGVCLSCFQESEARVADLREKIKAWEDIVSSIKRNLEVPTMPDRALRYDAMIDSIDRARVKAYNVAREMRESLRDSSSPRSNSEMREAVKE